MPSADDPGIAATRLMDEFARSTGISSDESARRYLWTDAFAVCNWLGLHAHTGERRFLVRALELVDQVHRVLGRHRDDDPRSGWISGLPEDEGARHPTVGGLRIGKPAPERGPEEPYDPRGEWNRDGQYYHYLTKWMHALRRLWEVTGRASHHRWAVELARAAQGAFATSAGGREHLYWKMSVDLSRPLVPSRGAHDPLDGFLTLSALEADVPAGRKEEAPGLDSEIRRLREMCRGGEWVTDDPLGAGGLLVDLLRCARLRGRGTLRNGEIRASVLEAAVESLEAAAGSGELRAPARQRLAFRELGLSVGLAAVERLLEAAEGGGAEGVEVPEAEAERLRRHLPLRRRIEEFWLEPRNRAAETWRDHLDISRVMLATSLAPEGYLGF